MQELYSVKDKTKQRCSDSIQTICDAYDTFVYDHFGNDIDEAIYKHMLRELLKFL